MTDKPRYMEKYDGYPVEIAEMPKWKSKILNAVAYILGYRKENAYVITLNFDWHKKDNYEDI